MSIPGVRGIEHIGLTVPDLDEADTFLTEILGCERIYSLGAKAHPDEGDDWMLEHLAVHPRTVLRRIAFYRLGNGSNLEVIEYEPADVQRDQPRNSDIGATHLALYVDDLDAAVRYLKDRGVPVLGDPTASAGAAAGQRWVYFAAPWGMNFEVVSYPRGKAYETGTPRLLWHPARPAA